MSATFSILKDYGCNVCHLIGANVKSVCEGVIFKLLQLHICFVVDKCFMVER
jgi:hypothetical protein